MIVLCSLLVLAGFELFRSAIPYNPVLRESRWRGHAECCHRQNLLVISDSYSLSDSTEVENAIDWYSELPEWKLLPP
jgi:hypothetical protein